MGRPHAASEALEKSKALHDEIRDALRRALEAIGRLKAREAGAFQQVCDAARNIARAVRKHNEVESHTLAPVLADIDAWGKERVRALGEGHRCAEEACDLHLELPDDVEGLISAVEGLVREVVRVLRAEEREFFDSHVLDDDPIVTDQLDG